MNNFFEHDILTGNITNQLMDILQLPDDIFDKAYPSIKEEITKTYKSGELYDTFFKGLNKEKQNEIFNTLTETASMLDTDDAKEFLSENKRDYLRTIIDYTQKLVNDIPYRDTVKVSIELCNENAKIPTYAHDSDAGCDVYSAESTTLMPHETKIIHTGLKIAVPDGWMVSVRPRSGLSAKTNIRVANAPGTIDAGYRDEVGIILQNTGNEKYDIEIGDRIAQFVIEPAPMIQFEVVENVNDFGENRGGGFGSTGQ